MARTIHCTVVEVPAMSDPYLPVQREFRDLVPWADPYIASLLTKLQRTAHSEESRNARSRFAAELHDKLVDELPPPLDKDDREDHWRPDWSPRNWPRG